MMTFRSPLIEDTELRLLEPRYAGEQYALIEANRERLRCWLDWVEQIDSLEDTRAYNKLTLDQYARGKSLVAGIWHRGRYAGNVGLEHINSLTGSAEIGYWLGEEFEGYGLVTHACRALVAHAFGALGLLRLQIRVEADNARSRAVPRRLGFRRQGTFRKVGRVPETRVELEVYSLPREEWDGVGTPLIFAHPLRAGSALRVMEPRYAGERTALIAANYSHLSRWLGWVDQYGTVEDNERYGRYALEQFAQETGVITGIWHHGRYAGSMVLLNIDQCVGSAEIGYWLGEEFQGQGLATDACRAMIRYAFDALGLNHLRINVQPGNTRSRAIPLRLGFQYAGTTPRAEYVNGQLVDLEVYALLRSEWKG